MICISIAPLLSSQVYHPIHYKRTNLLGQVCYGERVAEKRLHHDFFPMLFLSRFSSLHPPPPFGYAQGLPRAREGSFALSKGRESRVTVSGVYGNLTGVWFSKRAEDFAPGRTFVRSSCTWGCERRTRGEGRGYDHDGDIKTQYPMGRRKGSARTIRRC